MVERTMHWLRDPRERQTSLDELEKSLDELEIAEASGSCLAPTIPDGALLYIDTRVQARSGDYVLLKMPRTIEGTDIDETVKQLLFVEEQDGTQLWVIRNSAGMFRLVDEKITGVVVAFIVTPGRTSELGHLVDAAHAKTIANIENMRAGG